MTDGPAQLSSGMIGLGNMGGRIARRIRDGGLPVRGFDVSEEQAAAAGVGAEASIAALAGAVDVVFLSLPDSAVIESVVFGDGGLASSLRSGQVVVDLSTASPTSSVRIHDRLADAQVAFLDAGISGGAAAAEQGTLTLMVGGDGSALERVRPILDTFSTGVHHMGARGSGHTAKVLNNFLNGVSLAATAEVMVAAKRAGLDLAQFLEVVNTSSGVNFATLNRFPRIVEGDYLEGGLTNRLMAKDIRVYLEFLQAMSVTSFCGPACLGAFNLATALGYGDQISNRVVDAIGDVAGGVRIQR
jgi:3-hydroxyisobutyrate dehydrogenase-like beta-hydroxyacid dehydrogenase